MATRIHVTALRGASPEAMRNAFPKLANAEIEEANGWCWFSASVWGIGAGELLNALDGVGETLLVATTEDACRWYLQLRRDGLDPYVVMHSWRCADAAASADRDELYEDWEEDCENLMVEIGPPAIPDRGLPPIEWRDPFFEPYEESEDFDEEEDDEDYDESTLYHLKLEYEELGIPLSEAIVAELEGVPDEEVHDRFMELHAAGICDALDRFGIAHDRATVTEVLTGKNVTQVEAGWDIGNLPRFLAALGLGPKFDEMLEKAEAEQREWDAEEPEHYADDVLPKMPHLDMVPLDRPVRVPLEEAPLLFRAGYWTHQNLGGAFTAVLPSGTTYTPPEYVPSYLSVREEDGIVQIGACCSESFIPRTPMRRIGDLLKTLPNGTRLTLHLQNNDAPCQRYDGVVNDGAWQVEAACPPLPAARLEEAVALFREVAEGSGVRALDEAEVDAIEAALGEDFKFHDAMPKRDGLHFTTRRRWRDDLATLFWRRRFGDLYDCSAAIAENAENLARWRQTQREMEVEERLPVTDKVILDGEASTYLEADLELAAEDFLLEVSLKRLPKVTQQIELLGFQHLGDLVCERVGNVILRAFANETEKAYGVIYAGGFGATWCEFYTPFADGTSLTTTSSAMECSIPALRILMHHAAGESPKGLLEHHREGLRILADHGIKDVVLMPTLEGMAWAVDAFLLKRMPDEE